MVVLGVRDVVRVEEVSDDSVVAAVEAAAWDVVDCAASEVVEVVGAWVVVVEGAADVVSLVADDTGAEEVCASDDEEGITEEEDGAVELTADETADDTADVTDETAEEMADEAESMAEVVSTT